MCGGLMWGIKLGAGGGEDAGGGAGMVAPGNGANNGFCGGPITPGGAGAFGLSNHGGRPEMIEGPLTGGSPPMGTFSQSEPGPGRGL
ncbi:hypothetical protein BST14_13635 [Mycobacterium arosiense ATCC BAA-1401 = DSM 45069]|uniref:Uncharacterized protein n=1 Tax=Mycobacterium arosiense ATCC BAA-1401 = DSM 45069 TaxID=1265311 RepID=A0A1W9ZGF0_MYCAI|nr:hypothetical protein BST14_13635 [Mycobacterium arosiense ATCC BAA-1401 = DSM 45069]